MQTNQQKPSKAKMHTIDMYKTVKKIPDLDDREAKLVASALAQTNDAATKTDLEKFQIVIEARLEKMQAEMRADMKDMRADMKDMRAEAQAEIKDVRADMKTMKAELEASINKMGFNILKWAIATNVAIASLIGTIVVAMVKLL